MKISKKKLTMIFGITLIMSIALSSTAYAIKYGQPDDDAHPYVCWIVSYPGSGQYVYLGTGALISPTVVLTAGHVADIGDSGSELAWVTFETDTSWPPSPVWSPPGHGSNTGWIEVFTWETHPDYAIGVSPKLKDWITHDVGVIILDEPVILDEYAELPDPGLVDALPMMQKVDLVGYGLQYQIRGWGLPPPANWDWDTWPPSRYNSTAQLIATSDALSDEFIKLTANPAKGKGGTVFGDSGSPILLAGSNVTIAVCSWGTNGNCAGVGYQQRIDSEVILNWIDGFMP